MLTGESKVEYYDNPVQSLLFLFDNFDKGGGRNEYSNQ